MRTYEPYVPSFENPYPDRDWIDVRDFSFRSDLQLLRFRSGDSIGGDLSDRELQYVVSESYEFGYTIVYADGDEEIRSGSVPRGMLTDLTSVPRMGRIFIGRVGPHLEAAIVHDWLFVAWQDIKARTGMYEARERDFRFANAVMRAGMIASGVSALKRSVIFLSVSSPIGRATYKSEEPIRYVDLAGYADGVMV